MSDLQAYLASKYMSGPKADAILARVSTSTSGEKPKKKKRKVVAEASLGGAPGSGSGSTGLIVDDEDESLRWGGGPSGSRRDEEEEGWDGDVPVLTDVPKTFSKTKANWSTLNSSSALALPETTPQSTAPAVAKRKGGLVSKEELDLEASQKAEERRQEAARIEREREERRRVAREAGLDEDAAAEETVYRDREGRKVDIRAERDEEARKMQEEKRAERERKEWSKGLIQRQEAERRRETEAKMRSTAVARRADDREMNEELRAEQRAEDPAAAFLTRKKKRGPQRPRCPHPAPPNRFGILPGFRWDGVDRGNGFEAKMFQAQNEKKRNEVAKAAWSMEDM